MRQRLRKHTTIFYSSNSVFHFSLLLGANGNISMTKVKTNCKFSKRVKAISHEYYNSMLFSSCKL